MALPEVTVQDIANRYEGDLMNEFRESYLQAQLGDAVSYVTTRWRARIEERLAAGLLDENLYRRAIADAVLRVTRNPNGLASEGEGGYNWSSRATVASGNLWFTDADIDTLIGPEVTGFPGTIGIGLDRGWR